MSGSTAVPGDDAIQFDESFILKVEDAGEPYAALIGVLDELYRVRATSFVRYLVDWKPYTNTKTLRLRNLVDRIARANEGGIVELVDLLEFFGSTPQRAMFNLQTAHANYTDWKNLLPRLLRSQQKTVACTENALTIIVGCPGAERVQPILETQLSAERIFLAELREWGTTFAAE